MNNRVLLEIKSGGRLNLSFYGIEGKCVKHLWSVYDHKILDDPLNSIKLKHNQGVFLEDKFHDWNISDKNILHYYTRISEVGRVMKVIIELK